MCCKTSLSTWKRRSTGHHRLFRLRQNNVAALPELFGNAGYRCDPCGRQTLWDAADPATHRESEVRKKRLHFGLVFQNFNLFPQYTALQNITLAGELLAKEKPEYKANRKAIHAELEEKARTLLAQMGLSERENHYPHQLSGGQQQRVAIARALALEPDILCFDEPTSALDPELTGEVLRVLRDLADQKTTMIIVTHEMSLRAMWQTASCLWMAAWWSRKALPTR